MLTEAELRIHAERWRLARIHVEGEFAVLTYRSARRIEALAKANPRMIRVVDERTAYVPLEEKNLKAAVVAGIVRGLLAKT